MPVIAPAVSVWGWATAQAVSQSPIRLPSVSVK